MAPTGLPSRSNGTGQHASEASGAGNLLRVLGIGQRILDLHDRPLHDRAAGYELAVRPGRQHLLERLQHFRRVVVAGREVD